MKCMVICSVAHTKIPRTYSNISLKKIYQPKDNKETSCHLKNLKKFVETLHCVKSVRIRSCSGSVFSRIRTEFGEIRSISPYSVWMWENTDQNNSDYGYFSRSVCQRWVKGGALQLAGANWRPYQTSLMELFCEKISEISKMDLR